MQGSSQAVACQRAVCKTSQFVTSQTLVRMSYAKHLVGMWRAKKVVHSSRVNNSSVRHVSNILSGCHMPGISQAVKCQEKNCSDVVCQKMVRLSNVSS